MIHNILRVTISLFIFNLQGFPQVSELKSPFIAGAIGAVNFNTGDEFRNTGSLSLAFSSSFGIPVINNLFIYGRVTYSSKQNFSAYINEIRFNENLSAINTLQLANASFSQLVFNAGLLYHIKLTDEIYTGLSSGLTYSILNQEAWLQNGNLISELNNEGVYGYFGGLLLEKKFPAENFSIFAETQYNYIKSDAVYFRRAFSGMNFTFGVRYFLISRN